MLSLDLPEALAAGACLLLHGGGALGVEVRDHEHPVPPGVAAPGMGRAIVVAWFGPGSDPGPVASAVRALGSSVRVEQGVARDDGWAESWKAHFPPTRVAGRLWIVPPWEPIPEGPCVVIEPGMAFGTGAHATTRLCLEALCRLIEAPAAPAVLDVGCGSGILAIAARKLGAGRVVAVDNDPEAVAIARQNAIANGCADLPFSAAPIERVAGSFDIVVANILAVTLVDLARPIARRLARRGRLLLSGALVDQVTDVRAAYEQLGLAPTGVVADGEWALIQME